ncbi:MAG: hypothetical protein A2202_07015 [Bdellovibrionales bacterium RIFOXYA1_FULL_36_14]|nr:MAG: hypothetical protein A2202_07015 [Bdellovibrionales bacterium RIFOXYA1_FULL_36_14]
MQYTLLTFILIALLNACDLSDKSAVPVPCNGKNYCHIYISENTTKGNLATSGSGIEAADAICTASKPPNTGNVKAFLVDGTTRRACATADCDGEHIDWVLSTGREYRRTGGAIVIGTANIDGLIEFNLLSAFYPTAGTIYTGMNANYTTGNDCSNWTSTMFTGAIGDLESIDSAAIHDSDSSCNNLHHLLCVEQ